MSENFYYERKIYNNLTIAVRGEIATWIHRTRGKGKFAIVNPDIDGLSSYRILKRFDPSLQFGGYYFDEKNLLLSPEANRFRSEVGKSKAIQDFISVENDLLTMDSIGQHFCLLDNPNFAKVNPNALRYGTIHSADLDRIIYDNFHNKHPLSTSFFYGHFCIFMNTENVLLYLTLKLLLCFIPTAQLLSNSRISTRATSWVGLSGWGIRISKSAFMVFIILME